MLEVERECRKNDRSGRGNVGRMIEVGEGM